MRDVIARNAQFPARNNQLWALEEPGDPADRRVIRHDPPFYIKLGAKKMEFPANVQLPFFAYGTFRPGELAYLRIKPFVESVNNQAVVKGDLWIRDGLPLLDAKGDRLVDGALIHFRSPSSGSAYFSIIELEPDKQYQWDTAIAKSSLGELEANVLTGVDIQNGCVHPDRRLSVSDDPLFKEAFELIDESLAQVSEKDQSDEPNPNFRNFLRLQMAYMLLWTSIERYASLRYSLGDNVMKKILQLGSDPFFAQALNQTVHRTDRLYATNDPANSKKLNKDSPKKSLEYYYQVRCNITHRGKAAFKDFHRLKSALSELSAIFRQTFENALRESASP